MLIDLHLHTVRKPGLERSNGETFATPARLVQRMDEIGVSQGVLLPIVSPEGSHLQVLTEEVLEAAQDFPGRFIPFCNVDPRADTNTPQANLGRVLEYYIRHGCKGLGEITANIPWDDPRVHNLFAACQSHKLPVTFHIGPQMGGCYGLIDEPGLPGLERALQRFPDLIFLGHSQPFWAEMAPDYGEAGRNGYPKGPIRPGGRLPELFARYPNLCGDLSAGSGYNAVSRDPDFGCYFMETYQDRLLFATDICAPNDATPLPGYLASMVDAGRLSDHAYDQIAWRNANRLLNLSLTG